jgi:hypothetical protein
MREYSPFEGGIFMMGVPSSSVGALLWEVHLKHYGALMEEVTLLIVVHSSRVWLLWSRSVLRAWERIFQKMVGSEASPECYIYIYSKENMYNAKLDAKFMKHVCL